MAGQKEYEVELQFSSGILNVPDRIKAAEDVTFDGEKVPLIHNDDDLDNISNEQGRDSQTGPRCRYFFWQSGDPWNKELLIRKNY